MAKMDMGKLFSSSPRRKFRYSFTVLGLENSSGEGAITSFARAVSSPQLTLEPVEVVHQTEKVYYPGRVTWGDIDLTLVDVEENGPLSVIWDKWIKSYYVDPSRGYLSWRMSDVKKTCILSALDAKGSATSSWTIEGAWPTSINPGDWDYSSSEVQEISLTLKYDRAYYTG